METLFNTNAIFLETQGLMEWIVCEHMSYTINILFQNIFCVRYKVPFLTDNDKLFLTQ